MPLSHTVDGFQLAYDETPGTRPVVLLHGWPGDRSDFREVVPRLPSGVRAIVPDLRGFGASDKHAEPASTAYSAPAQARSVLGLMDELAIDSAVLAGYDIGSRVAQTIAQTSPQRVQAVVLSPPLPGVGQRVLTPEAHREYWYQAFHQLDLVELLIDGDATAVRAYLRHFWTHWSGESFTLPDADLEHLVEVYSPPGAFIASIAWYRAGSGTVARSMAEVAPTPGDRIHTPTTVLWPDSDPLFPLSWSDRVDAFFTDITVRRLRHTGHYTPLEAPAAFADTVVAAVG
jgi:pimeloyl-ACP methyl ester carboxylesterase